MINQTFTYLCDSEDVEKAKNLFRRLENSTNLSRQERREFRDEIERLLKTLKKKRSDFMDLRIKEVLDDFKKMFNCEDCDFQELNERLPGLKESFNVTFNLNPNCEDIISRLTDWYKRLD